jgi:hypothetical protein
MPLTPPLPRKPTPTLHQLLATTTTHLLYLS